jgi:uncharacterized protein
VLNLDGVPPIGAVIHLAGENIGTRWTAGRKLRIRESRVRGTQLLSRAIANLPDKPRIFISASAIGIYGDRGDELLTESSPPGNPTKDFLVQVCLGWEAAADPARAAGIRVVHPRFGVVLSTRGGALKKLLLPFRLGLGGRQGDGSQWMSWIAIDDVVGAILWLLSNDGAEGPFNLSAPAPLRNRDFIRTLGHALRRPTPLPIPAAALRLGLGEMAQSTLLASARVHPSKLLEGGYNYRYPGLDSALQHLLSRQSSFAP